MDDPNRSIAKRQIARLLGSSSIPFCVLSEENTLVFANEAMGLFIGRPSESLLGLQCHSEIPADGTLDAPLSAFFALPVDWKRERLKLLPESGRPPIAPDSTFVENGSKPKSTVSNWIRCLIPLEDDGCVLCAFCPTSDVSINEILDVQSASIQKIMRANRNKYLHLDSLWYLQGPSIGARRALDQVQIAIDNPLSLTVFGQSGSGRTWLAQTIQLQRRKLSASGKVAIGDSMIRIDCSLMDNELLASMLESIDEIKGYQKVSSAVLLDNLEGLPGECVSVLTSFLKKHDQTVCIATCDPSSVPSLTQGSVLWGELLSRAGVLRIDLPKLVDRLVDIPTLVNAWFGAQPQSRRTSCEISEPFLDALVAYSWTGDVEEFSEALAHASTAKTDAKLTDKELPVNIRTCVSHIEQTQHDESVDLDAILEDVEKTMILRALERFPQNKTSAAKLLNISRARLLRRLQQWGIQSESIGVESDDDTPDFNEVK